MNVLRARRSITRALPRQALPRSTATSPAMSAMTCLPRAERTVSGDDEMSGRICASPTTTDLNCRCRRCGGHSNVTCPACEAVVAKFAEEWRNGAESHRDLRNPSTDRHHGTSPASPCPTDLHHGSWIASWGEKGWARSQLPRPAEASDLAVRGRARRGPQLPRPAPHLPADRPGWSIVVFVVVNAALSDRAHLPGMAGELQVENLLDADHRRTASRTCSTRPSTLARSMGGSAAASAVARM